MSIKNFGRLALISGFVFGVSAIAPVAVLANGTTEDTASTGQLQGTVEPITTLTWSTDGGSESFNFTLDANGAGTTTSQNIGTLTYLTNVPGNWTIGASSVEGGALQSDAGAYIMYTAKFAAPTAIDSGITGTAVANPGGLPGNDNPTKELLLSGAVDGSANNITHASAVLSVNFASGYRVPAGIYKDTISFEFKTNVGE